MSSTPFFPTFFLLTLVLLCVGLIRFMKRLPVTLLAPLTALRSVLVPLTAFFLSVCPTNPFSFAYVLCGTFCRTRADNSAFFLAVALWTTAVITLAAVLPIVAARIDGSLVRNFMDWAVTPDTRFTAMRIDAVLPTYAPIFISEITHSVASRVLAFVTIIPHLVFKASSSYAFVNGML